MSNAESKKKSFVSDFLVPILVALVLAFIINKFIVFKIYIPSESMSPTLEVGDNCFATVVYNKDNIKRGDIIVFYSEELDSLLIKRVIGLPGEKVEIDDTGTVYINGEKYEEPYVVNQSDMMGSFEVPEDHYLFLGDNRANSKDARFWQNKYIHKDNIKGKARVTVFPFNRFRILK
ncbi:signal peptidase I [Clostridium thermarum]|uniref:signal peptidase I n=1 Tax=Clostridium thermarum TaxID=1716543 RepID=UPI001123300F|nr:signal peptidase I [Clostridium thermarum]